MVESLQDAGILDSKLEKEWNRLASTQASTSAFLSTNLKRPLDEGHLVAFFNAKLVSI
jgi:hypothetical protein